METSFDQNIQKKPSSERDPFPFMILKKRHVMTHALQKQIRLQKIDLDDLLLFSLNSSLSRVYGRWMHTLCSYVISTYKSHK